MEIPMAEIARNVGYVDQLSLRQFKRRSQRIKIHRFHQRPPQLHSSSLEYGIQGKRPEYSTRAAGLGHDTWFRTWAEFLLSVSEGERKNRSSRRANACVDSHGG